MVKIAVTGIGKERIAELALASGGGEVQVEIKTDLEAAFAVKAKQADYYIGACQSGAGGALGVATAILGSSDAVRLSGTGTLPDLEEVAQAVREGRHAFGIMHSHIESVVPVLVREMVEKSKTSGQV
ncbi:MAG: yhfU [Acidimicrobiaceae bacterium]|nr:yhfU [Acidimicrobiaceae bacterium]